MEYTGLIFKWTPREKNPNHIEGWKKALGRIKTPHKLL